MADTVLIEIIKLCMWLESKAIEIYRHLAEDEQDERHKRFWIDMEEGVKSHLMYWGYLLTLAEEGKLPRIFPKMNELKDELEKVKEKVRKLVENYYKDSKFLNGFLIVCRLEFSMLHETLMNLLHYVQSISEELTPEDDYNLHVKHFIESFNRISKTPEVELLGDVVKKYLYENRNLMEQSFHDFMTGVFNKRGFYKTISPLIHIASRNKYNVGIVIINVDNFKKINTDYGHQMGDRMLKFAAETIQYNTRRSDVVARSSNDEFIVYLSMVNEDFLSDVALRLQQSISLDSKKIVPITVSVGAAQGYLTENPESDIEYIIEKANINLYKVKESGGNNLISSST